MERPKVINIGSQLLSSRRHRASLFCVLKRPTHPIPPSTHRLLGTHNDGVADEAVFVLLHFVNLIRLILWRAVVMNYPDTAVQLEEEGVEEEQLNSV